MVNVKLEMERGTEKGIKAERAAAREKIDGGEIKTERTRAKKEKEYLNLSLF